MAFAPPQQQQPQNYGAGAVLSEQLEIFISCRNLPKMDLNSPSDPFVVISQKSEATNRFVELFKTEVVMDNNDPEFTKQIKIDYRFEEVQLIRFDVYDADSKNLHKLSEHDYIGFCDFVLGDLVTSNGCKLAMKLKDKKGKQLKVRKAAALCIVRSEEVKMDNDEFGMTLRDASPNAFAHLTHQ